MDMKIIAPILIIQLILIVIALRDLIPRDASRVKGENKIIWAIVIVFGNVLGSLIYLFVGRKD